jgi:hypothetical protein
VYLANVSAPGSNEAFSLNPAAPFLDLSNRTIATGELGMMGLAMHPDFVHNGRFFVSYDCDTYAVPDCAAKCACDRSTSLCNTSAIGSSVCRYTAVVAEYTANASGISPSMVSRFYLKAFGEPFLSSNLGCRYDTFFLFLGGGV